MSINLVNIEIDGMPLQAESGSMLIEVADEAGIKIPRFCYHKKLSVAANCRMCLVEVERAPKPLPACATPVAEGMKVFTRSPKAIAAQKGTMEFLLINHPLDCPICDQGGECELQDVSMAYGDDVSHYSEAKRVVKDKNIGPLIATEMTRCIHCTRCVRFGEEIAGLREMGATGRGEFMEIGTYVEHSISSELSGNVIDLCPVGALTAKPSRFAARAWEMVQHASVAPHDCIGSNLYLHTYQNNLVRAVPRDNEEINECWLSDRDRFSYESLTSEERLLTPMIKVKGQWQETDWDTALNKTAEALLAAVPDHLAGLCSANATTEELYLFQKLLRALGSPHIDHRLAQKDFSDQEQAPLFPWLGDSLATVRSSPFVFLLGADVRKEQPLLGHMLRQSVLEGGKVLALNPRDFHYTFEVLEQWIADPEAMVRALAAVTKQVCADKGTAVAQSVQVLLDGVEVTDQARRYAEILTAQENGNLLIGSWAMSSPYLAVLRALAATLADATGLKLGYLSVGGNAAGAWLAGAVPHRGPAGKVSEQSGMTVAEMNHRPVANYLLFNVEPEADGEGGAELLSHMKEADFVVSVTSFADERMRDYADVLLPLAGFAETSGTFVNCEGRWQGFNGAARPAGASRPGWKILRVLGNLTGKDGFEYMGSEEVREELKGLIARDTEFSNRYEPAIGLEMPAPVEGTRAVGFTPIYAGDALVRRAASLQQTPDAGARFIIGPDLAQALDVADGDMMLVRQGGISCSLPADIDEGVPGSCVFVPRGVEATLEFVDCFGAVEVMKV
jgi:NADH-quinone oxidoreductase subunit G